MIKDFIVGDAVGCSLVLKVATLRKTKTGKDYLAVTFTDGESSISGNIWDYNVNKGILPLNTVYEILGSIGEYQGTKQLNITKVAESDNQDMSRFSCTYCNNSGELWQKLLDYAKQIPKGDLRTITEWILYGYRDELIHGSAAKSMHHVGIGGLNFHLLDTVKYADALGNAVSSMYPSMPINKGLTIAGATLHDIGKIYTYNINGAAVDMAPTGMLYEHITVGMQIVMDAAGILKLSTSPDSAVGMLLHVIASHHEKLEFGSPVTPRCVEAYIVATADKLSSVMDMFNTANKNAREDVISTDKVYALDNHEMLKQSFVSIACNNLKTDNMFEEGSDERSIDLEHNT